MLTSIGETLSTQREAHGKSIQDVERAIKIRAKFIQALEADDFDAIPGDAYVLGFIKSYCDFLGIDPSAFLDMYRSEHETPKLQMPQPVMSSTHEHPRLPRFLWVGALSVVLVVFAGYLGFSLVSALKPTTPVPEPTTTVVVAEPTRTAQASVPAAKPKAAPPRLRAFTLKVSAVGGPNWLVVKVDGRKVFDGGLGAGQSIAWRVRKRAILRSDSPTLFRVFRNGRFVGLLGTGSSLKQRVLTWPTK